MCRVKRETEHTQTELLIISVSNNRNLFTSKVLFKWRASPREREKILPLLLLFGYMYGSMGRSNFNRVKIKKKSRTKCPGFLFVQLDRSGDLTGTHTPGTNIHMAGRTVHNCLHTLHVGFPSTIGTTVRVRNLNAESHALIAKLALSHPLHLLAVAYFRAYLHKHA